MDTSVIGARSSLLVFAASSDVVHIGPGVKVEDYRVEEWFQPPAWNTSDIGNGCPRISDVPIRTLDLSKPQNPTKTPMNLAITKVFATAIPSALAQWGSLLDIMVLLYQTEQGKTMFGLDIPLQYVVFLNANRRSSPSGPGIDANGGG